MGIFNNLARNHGMLLPAALAALGLASPAMAATIAWETPVNFNTNSAELTKGVVYALNFSGRSITDTATGVTFVDASASKLVSHNASGYVAVLDGPDLTTTNYTNNGSSSGYTTAIMITQDAGALENHSTGDSNFDRVLNYDCTVTLPTTPPVWSVGGYGTTTFTLHGLTNGSNYRVQLFLADTNNSGYHQQFEFAALNTPSTNGKYSGSTPTVYSPTGSLGTYIIGDFTADSTTQSFILAQYQNYGSSGLLFTGSQLNALILTDPPTTPIPEPATGALLLAGTGLLLRLRRRPA